MFELLQSLHAKCARFRLALALSLATILGPQPLLAQYSDQHSVEVIIAALNAEIPQELIDQARELDDQLMMQGEYNGQRVYLVTDERSVGSNALVERLLTSMGEDPNRWKVRVFETDEPVPNAFVTGGKYVYLFDGLIEQATSEDELAFVLAHELGHSLLKQSIRQQNDESALLIGLAQLGAMLSNKNAAGMQNLARYLESSYGRLDEEEADALAVVISRRAGFDPLRGVDFFSRMKRQKDQVWNDYQLELAQQLQAVQQEQANCKEWTDFWHAAWENQTQENADQANAICDNAGIMGQQYNQNVAQFNQSTAYQQQEQFFRSHPQDQSRIAAIAALTDYLAGRRDLESLQKFEHSAKVMTALNWMNSDLLLAPEIIVAENEPANSDSE